MSSEVSFSVGLFGNDNPFSFLPVHSDLPTSSLRNCNDGEGGRGKRNETGNSQASLFLFQEESAEGGLDISRERVFSIGKTLEVEVLIVAEDISCFDVEDVGSSVLVFFVKVADFEVSSVV